MKKLFLIIPAIVVVVSCAPVLNSDLMKRAVFDMRLSDIKGNPDFHKGKLYVLGGIIANTTITKEGALIEAIYVPVNSRGFLRGVRASNGRFLAIYRGRELLDPLIFGPKREITLAGEFIGVRTGKIGEMDYTYPLFDIKEIYLWEERKDYYYISPPYPLLYYPPWWYDPWWRYY